MPVLQDGAGEPPRPGGRGHAGRCGGGGRRWPAHPRHHQRRSGACARRPIQRPWWAPSTEAEAGVHLFAQCQALANTLGVPFDPYFGIDTCNTADYDSLGNTLVCAYRASAVRHALVRLEHVPADGRGHPVPRRQERPAVGHPVLADCAGGPADAANHGGTCPDLVGGVGCKLPQWPGLWPRPTRLRAPGATSPESSLDYFAFTQAALDGAERRLYSMYAWRTPRRRPRRPRCLRRRARPPCRTASTRATARRTRASPWTRRPPARTRAPSTARRAASSRCRTTTSTSLRPPRRCPLRSTAPSSTRRRPPAPLRSATSRPTGPVAVSVRVLCERLHPHGGWRDTLLGLPHDHHLPGCTAIKLMASA